MPTIQQLPAAQSVDAADLLAISQSGTLRAVSSGDLLAGTQPAIMAPTGSLLGRTSLGAGGPEALSPGPGLAIQGSTISANGGDHAGFPVETSLADSDQFVISSDGQPKLVPLSGLLSEFSVSARPVVTTLAATGLVSVSQNGTDAAISLANLLNGETIDDAAPAAAASDSDTVWVAQGGSMMLRQSFGAIWAWIAGKTPSYKQPVLEVSADTILDTSVHNGRLIVCSKPLTLTPAFPNMGNGFACDILNVSSGEVVLGAGIVSSSGQSSIGTYQLASLRAVSYSGGNLVFAAITGNGPGAVPGQVGGLSVSGITASNAALSWTPPASGGAVGSYLVQYEVSGTNSWLSVTVAGGTTSCTLEGLSSASSYAVTVTASNSSGAGQVSATVSFNTLASVSPPGQPQSLTVSNVQSMGVQLSWSAPSTGGAVSGYTVRYSAAGATGWTDYASNVAGTSLAVSGLTPATSYSFEVIATNAGGSGPPSSAASATTPAAGAVSSITWNLAPSAQYTAGSGSIGVNVHVSPSTAAVQFGLSASSTVAPETWTAGSLVNTDLWGTYVAVPGSAGTYYMWCEGTDGSAPTVYPTAITVS